MKIVIKKKNIQEKKKKSICSRMVYNSAKIQKKKRDIVMKVRQKTKRKKKIKKKDSAGVVRRSGRKRCEMKNFLVQILLGRAVLALAQPEEHQERNSTQ